MRVTTKNTDVVVEAGNGGLAGSGNYDPKPSVRMQCLHIAADLAKISGSYDPNEVVAKAKILADFVIGTAA